VSKSLEALARRVEKDPFFLAGLLADYAGSENLNDAGLAAALRCEPETLTAIRLCRAPRPDLAGFRQDVDEIAARFGLDADRLTAVVRRGETLRRLRSAAPSGHGFLAAARDGEPPPESEP
jgi:hypothetical protein